jgi:type II secretory pathway predicted ATPase ExeA
MHQHMEENMKIVLNGYKKIFPKMMINVLQQLLELKNVKV